MAGTPPPGGYTTLRWLRRRRFWNSLRAAWRRSKALFVMLALMTVFVSLLTIANGSSSATQPASDAARNGAGSYVALFLDVVIPLYALAPGVALGADSLAEYDLLYTTPIPRTLVLRERIQSALLLIAALAAVVGLFAGDLLSQVYGLPSLPIAGWIALALFPIVATAVVGGLHLSLWSARLSARARRRWTAGISLGLAALVLGGLPSLWLRGSLASSDPLPAFLSTIGVAQVQLILHSGFDALTLLVAVLPWVTLITVGLFAATHEYRAIPPLARGPPAASLEIQAGPSAGAAARLQRLLRASYQDPGEGAMALRGLITTLALRSPGVWMAGGFGVLIVFLLLGLNSGTGSPGGAVGAVFGLGTGSFAVSFGAIFANLGPAGASVTEQARLGPFSGKELFREVSRPAVLVGATLAFVVTLALAVIREPWLFAALALGDLLALSLVAAFGLSLQRLAAAPRPTGVAGVPGVGLGRTLLFVVAMSEFFVLVVVPTSSWGMADELVGVLLTLNVGLAAYGYASGIRAASRPPLG